MSRFLIGINSAKCGNNAAYFSLLLRLNRTSQAIIRRQNIYFTLCGSRGCGETPPQITFSFLHVRSTLPPAIYCCYLLYWSTIQFLSHQHWQRFVTEVRFPSVCEAVMAESKARFHKCSYFARLFFSEWLELRSKTGASMSNCTTHQRYLLVWIIVYHLTATVLPVYYGETPAFEVIIFNCCFEGDLRQRFQWKLLCAVVQKH